MSDSVTPDWTQFSDEALDSSPLDADTVAQIKTKRDAQLVANRLASAPTPSLGDAIGADVGSVGQGLEDAGHGIANVARKAAPYAAGLAGAVGGYAGALATGPFAPFVMPAAMGIGADAAFQSAGGQPATSEAPTKKEGDRQGYRDAVGGAPLPAHPDAADGGAHGLPGLSIPGMESFYHPTDLSTEKADITKTSDALGEAAANEEVVKADKSQQVHELRFKAEQIDNLASMQRQRAWETSQKVVADAVKRKEEAIAAQERGEIDTNHLFKNEAGETSYGRVIAAAISVGLGAAGASLTGGPNFALQIINGAIDRDIAAQKEHLAKLRDIVGYRTQDIKDLEASAYREDERKSNLQIQAYTHAMTQAEAFAQSTTDPEAKANAAKVQATFANARSKAIFDAAEKEGELHDKAATNAINAWHARASIAIEAQRNAIMAAKTPSNKSAAKHHDAIQRAVEALKSAMDVNEDSLAPIPGTAGHARGPAAQVKLEAALGALNEMHLSQRTHDLLAKAVGGNPADSLGSNGRRAIYQDLILELQREAERSGIGAGGNEGFGAGGAGEAEE